MSVKIICDDAKKFMEEQLQKWKLWVKTTEVEPWRFDRNALDSLPLLKELIGTTEKELQQPEAWEKSASNPPSIFADGWAKGMIFCDRKNAENMGTVIRCCNALFEVRGFYSEEEAKLLVQNKVKKMRGEVDYLKFRKDIKDDLNYERLPIPEDVRNDVWRRDQGKCVRCSSVYKLEFDHIIPVTKGGSNTARNIQLLCEPCNRQKSNNIG